jgi:hypothetical protein
MGKVVILYLRLRAISHTIYAAQIGCFIVQPSNFKQTITHQHVLSRLESLIDGTAIAIRLCLHILIAHRIFINFLDMSIIFCEL